VNQGIEAALESGPELRSAVMVHAGQVIDEDRAKKMFLAGQSS